LILRDDVPGAALEAFELEEPLLRCLSREVAVVVASPVPLDASFSC
jgi:hypothetical protein